MDLDHRCRPIRPERDCGLLGDEQARSRSTGGAGPRGAGGRRGTHDDRAHRELGACPWQLPHRHRRHARGVRRTGHDHVCSSSPHRIAAFRRGRRHRQCLARLRAAWHRRRCAGTARGLVHFASRLPDRNLRRAAAVCAGAHRDRVDHLRLAGHLAAAGCAGGRRYGGDGVTPGILGEAVQDDQDHRAAAVPALLCAGRCLYSPLRRAEGGFGGCRVHRRARRSQDRRRPRRRLGGGPGLAEVAATGRQPDAAGRGCRGPGGHRIGAARRPRCRGRHGGAGRCGAVRAGRAVTRCPGLARLVLGRRRQRRRARGV